jgi:hypothetical protein
VQALILVNAIGLAAFLIALGLVLLIGRRAAPWLAGLLTLALVLKSLLTWKPAWEAALFPWPDYIYLQGYWMTAIALAFFGTVIPLLPVVWNRWVVGAVAAGAFALGLHATWWMAVWRPIGIEQGPGSDHHFQQSTGYTCAPSSCAIALSYLGVAATEREMARLCLTRRDEGTIVFNTYRGLALKLEGTPWRARVRELPAAELREPGRVAVIDWPQLQHAVTTVGAGDHVVLHDPLRHDRATWTAAELDERYGGIAVVFERRE